MSNNDRTVYQREDGQWVNKRNESEQPSSVHETWGEARAVARRLLKKNGGGELVRRALDGTVLSREFVGPRDKDSPPDTPPSVESSTRSQHIPEEVNE